MILNIYPHGRYGTYHLKTKLHIDGIWLTASENEQTQWREEVVPFYVQLLYVNLTTSNKSPVDFFLYQNRRIEKKWKEKCCKYWQIHSGTTWHNLIHHNLCSYAQILCLLIKWRWSLQKHNIFVQYSSKRSYFLP